MSDLTVSQRAIAADPFLGPIMLSFAACLCAELASIGRPVCGCGCCLVWSEALPPMDFCDCHDGQGGQGQAWVRVVSWAPKSSSARRDPVSLGRRGSQCAPQELRVVLEAGLYRCVTAAQQDGQPPTCDDRTGDAIGLIADSRAVRRAILCCSAFKDKTLTFGGEYPVGPKGGCAGVYAQFSMDLN